MKKTSLAKRNAFLLGAQLSWGGGALFFVLALLALRMVAPNVLLTLVAPLSRVGSTLSTAASRYVPTLGGASSFVALNERLVTENQVLTNENSTLLQKTKDLAALLGTASSTPSLATGILAGVVAEPPEDPYSALTLSAGSRTGVKLGMEAFATGGAPIGVVSSVLPDFSRVTLFSAPGERLSAWIGPTEMPITIYGAGAGTFTASVPRAANVTVGEIIFAPGPGALPVGSVTRIDNIPSAPTVALRIAPVVNPASVAWVVLRESGTTLTSALSCATSTLP